MAGPRIDPASAVYVVALCQTQAYEQFIGPRSLEPSFVLEQKKPRAALKSSGINAGTPHDSRVRFADADSFFWEVDPKSWSAECMMHEP